MKVLFMRFLLYIVQQYGYKASTDTSAINAGFAEQLIKMISLRDLKIQCFKESY